MRLTVDGVYVKWNKDGSGEIVDQADNYIEVGDMKTLLAMLSCMNNMRHMEKDT